MKKIGIITLQSSNPNYGNLLQNYAVQSVFSKLGYQATTIQWHEYYDDIEYKIEKYVEKIRKKNIKIAVLEASKKRNFSKFKKKYINVKKIDIEKLDSNMYDYYSVGSDQVWNPTWYNDVRKNMYLLSFAENKKKICMAPSFGIDYIPKEWENWFTINLSSFKYLSAREEKGIEIIKALTGKNASVVIDPTMMIDKDEWAEIMKPPRNFQCKDKYILTYFLGGIDKNTELEIYEIARKNSCRIVNLLDTKQSNIFISGPSEFIYLIANAALVFTDSFHASVFSFLFNRPFLVYNRNSGGDSMNSRIETLLSTFKLERKYRYSNEHNDVWEHNYEEGYSILQNKCRYAYDFLIKSIE